MTKPIDELRGLIAKDKDRRHALDGAAASLAGTTEGANESSPDFERAKAEILEGLARLEFFDAAQEGKRIRPDKKLTKLLNALNDLSEQISELDDRSRDAMKTAIKDSMGANFVPMFFGKPSKQRDDIFELFAAACESAKVPRKGQDNRKSFVRWLAEDHAERWKRKLLPNDLYHLAFQLFVVAFGKAAAERAAKVKMDADDGYRFGERVHRRYQKASAPATKTPARKPR